MAKILLTMVNPPEGVNESQLFDNSDHFNSWLEALKDKFIDLQKTKTTLKFKGGSGKIENVSDDFVNFEVAKEE